TLAGISVIINQYIFQKVSLLAPLLGISQRNFCTDLSSPAPDCLTTFITVQVPFELLFFQNPIKVGPPCPVNVGGTCPQTEIVISEDGPSKKLLAGMPVADSIHIIPGCDIQALAGTEFAVPSVFGISSGAYSTCQSIAPHADGSPISPESPARPAE